MYVDRNRLPYEEPSSQLNTRLFLFDLGLKDEVLALVNGTADAWHSRYPMENAYEFYTHDCMGNTTGYPAAFGHVGENT